ncbi:MAG: hypothetical protein WKH64_07105 [Chloroflexia bacterium]
MTATTTQRFALTEAQVSAYSRDGYIHLPKVFTQRGRRLRRESHS